MYYMKLLHFFSCCTNSTVIEDPPSKTDDERLFEKELLRFYSFSTVNDNNSNIDDFYYCRDEYNNILKDKIGQNENGIICSNVHCSSAHRYQFEQLK